MANYEQDKAELKNSITDSEMSQAAKDSLIARLDKIAGTIKSVAEGDTAATVADVKGANTVDTKGGTVDLSKATSADMKNLELIQVTDGADTTLTIKNNSFDGTVITGDGNDKVVLTTNKSVTVETGAGNDTVTTSSGKDTVVISSGNDSVNTGSGNDKVDVKAGFTGTATVDGGKGTNTLDVTDSSSITFDANGQLVITIGESTVTAKNFNAVVLGDDGNAIDTSASKKALNITSGTGDDSISTGGGKDSITISGGNDSISTGAGTDIIKLAAGYFAVDSTVDGGAGNDKLDLTKVVVTNVTKSGTDYLIMLEDGSIITASNIENFVYDKNGADVKGGITTVGVKAFDAHFPDDPAA